MDSGAPAASASFLGGPQEAGTKIKKTIVKPPDFTYQFGQMHRVGAGGKLFLPQLVAYKKSVPK